MAPGPPHAAVTAAPRAPDWLVLVWRERLYYALVLPFAALVVVFGLWPIAQSIQVAFTDSATALGRSPSWVGLANFERVLADPYFRASLGRTLFYTLVSVVVNIGVALAYALLLGGRLIGRGNGFFRLAVFLPVIAPDVAGFIVWKWMYDQSFGAVNAALAGLGLPPFGGLADPATVLPALVVAELWKHVGFYTIVFLTNMTLLDPALDEAARIDGADTLQRFRHVTLPQLRPAILVNTVYAVIQFLKTFTVVVVMTKGGPSFQTNFVSYYAYQKFDEALYGEAAAMATTLFVIVIACAYGLYAWSERSDWR